MGKLIRLSRKMRTCSSDELSDAAVLSPDPACEITCIDLHSHDVTFPPGSRVTALCGRDNANPIARALAYAHSPVLHIALWPGTGSQWESPSASSLFALEGGCFVLSACGLSQRFYDCGLKGGSHVAAPGGEILLQPVDSSEPSCTTIEVDLLAATAAQCGDQTYLSASQACQQLAQRLHQKIAGVSH